MAPDLERELERTTALRGFRYGLHDFVAAVGGTEALKRHNDNTQATYLKQGLIDRKTKELLIVLACVASGKLVSHIQIHMHAAQKAGATPEEIMEALNFVGSWIGIRRVLGLEAWRATFRPDIPTIDRVVELKGVESRGSCGPVCPGGASAGGTGGGADAAGLARRGPAGARGRLR